MCQWQQSMNEGIYQAHNHTDWLPAYQIMEGKEFTWKLEANFNPKYNLQIDFTTNDELCETHTQLHYR